MAVGEDDSWVGLGLTILHNFDMLVLECDHMEGADALGALSCTALLGFYGVPPEAGHIVNDGLGVGHHILVGNTRICGLLVESERADLLNLVLAHDVAHVVVVE